MAPISIWVGHRSDTKPLFGNHRTSYIWLGRGLVLISFLLLGFGTVRLEGNTGDVFGWSIVFITFLIYGLGTLVSGSPYLALVRDSAPRSKQGIAIGIVETVLIAMFPVVAIGFSRMLTNYSPAMFWRLIIFVVLVGGFYWFFGVAGVEIRPKTITKRNKLTGNGLKFLSLLTLGFGIAQLEGSSANPFGGVAIVITFLLYSFGTLLSGKPYLLPDSFLPKKQGIVNNIVKTILTVLALFVMVGFGRILTNYTPAIFWWLFIIFTIVGSFIWYFATAKNETLPTVVANSDHHLQRNNLRLTFRKIWGDRRTRRFFVFLFVATFAAWMQDNILEPFGADVFDMAVGETTRLTGYWGVATILVLLASFYIWRKKRPEDQSTVTGIGLAIMGLGMLLVGGSAFVGQERFFLMALVVFGAGFGLYTFGGLSLMAAMSPDPNAGAYLGLWTVAILVSKGLGTFMGGVSRDVVLALSDGFAPAYGVTCLIAGIGLWTAVLILRGINVPAFVKENVVTRS